MLGMVPFTSFRVTGASFRVTGAPRRRVEITDREMRMGIEFSERERPVARRRVR
jgi:hypothetical protein